MTHATRFVAVVVLVALAAGAPVQAQGIVKLTLNRQTPPPMGR